MCKDDLKWPCCTTIAQFLKQDALRYVHEIVILPVHIIIHVRDRSLFANSKVTCNRSGKSYKRYTKCTSTTKSASTSPDSHPFLLLFNSFSPLRYLAGYPPSKYYSAECSMIFWSTPRDCLHYINLLMQQLMRWKYLHTLNNVNKSLIKLFIIIKLTHY